MRIAPGFPGFPSFGPFVAFLLFSIPLAACDDGSLSPTEVDEAVPTYTQARAEPGTPAGTPDAGLAGENDDPVDFPSVEADAQSETGNDPDPEPDPEPTPSKGALAINEIVADPEDGGNDWIELINVGAEMVSAAEYSLVDDNEDHEPAYLPDVELAPGEFLVVWAVDPDEPITDPSVPFKLGGSDTVSLSNSEKIIDEVVWEKGDAPEGASYGRLPDGVGAWQTLSPTPGAPNEALDEPLPEDSPWITDRVVDVEIDLSAEAWQAILDNPLDEEYHEGNITYDGVQVTSVAIRVKGNSSLKSVASKGGPRFSFKVDMNRYVDGQELLGVRKLNFNNGFKDPTLLREHLAYAVAREAGLPASRTAFADLTIAGLHLGMYTVVEQVDDEFLEDNFGDNDGDLYKPEMPDGNLISKGEEFSSYAMIGIENNEDTTDHSAFLALISALNEGDQDAIEAVLDVDAVLLYLAFNSVLVNLDSYNGMGHNYYIYEQEGRFTVIPWDLNEAFGNFNCGCDRDGIINLPIDEPTCEPLAKKPLISRLLLIEEYRQTYHSLQTALIDGPFETNTMIERIEAAADLIRPTVEEDTEKFYTTAEFETALMSDLTKGMGPQASVVIGLAPFVAERNESVLAQIAGQISSLGSGNGGCQNNGPGPGGGEGGGGGNNLCGDGLCDVAEQNDPNLCPQDCEE